jgi:hypothetical protein
MASPDLSPTCRNRAALSSHSRAASLGLTRVCLMNRHVRASLLPSGVRGNDEQERECDGRTGRDYRQGLGANRTALAAERSARWAVGRPSQGHRWHPLETEDGSSVARLGEVEWEVSVDATTARAHQHAAGARREPAQQDAKRGSKTSKRRHLGGAEED